jgi:hypothetical protein
MNVESVARRHRHMQFLVRKHIKRSVNKIAFSHRPKVLSAVGERERERFQCSHTCTTWWSLCCGRQREQMPPELVHSKQKRLHSHLCETPSIRHEEKNFVASNGFSHRGYSPSGWFWPSSLSILIGQPCQFETRLSTWSIWILELLMRKDEETNALAALTQTL